MLHLLLHPLQVEAQLHSLFYNNFVSFGVGGDCYLNDAGANMGFGFEVTYGKWLVSTAGVRMQFSPQFAKGVDEAQPYYYGHIDYLFDPVTSLRGVNRSRAWRSYCLAGVGFVHTMSGDNDFCAVAGVGLDRRLVGDWRLFGELKAIVHPSDFDHNTRMSANTVLTFGAVYDINYNPTRSRSSFETRGMAYDWFFQVGLGGCSFNYKGIGSFSDRLGLLSPIIEFNFGKRINTACLIRMGVSGLYARSSEELFSYYNVRGDLMLDISGILYPERAYTRFTARPYISTGVVSRLDDQTNFLISSDAGLQFVFRPDNRDEIFLEARYILTPPRFAHVEIEQSTFSVGMAMIVAGYSYSFGKNSFK